MEYKTFLMTCDEVCRLNVQDLQPHPENVKIYGTADVSDLIESIRDNGVLEPIIVKDGVIISGHRRAQACKELGLTFVPCLSVDKDFNEVEALVEFNVQREKCWSTKVMEALALEKVEAEKALIRKTAGQKDLGQNSAQGERRAKTASTVAQKIFKASRDYLSSSKKVKELVESTIAPGVDWRTHELVVDLDSGKRKLNGVLRILKSQLEGPNSTTKEAQFTEEDYQWVDETILWYLDPEDEEFTPARKKAALKWLRDKVKEVESLVK
jgi:hypothetical protein